MLPWFMLKQVQSGLDFERKLPLGTGHTAAPRSILTPFGPPSTFLDGAAKGTKVGNPSFIALVKDL